VTHTSDSFEICEKYAVQMIKEGKAYMDDTEQEKMQAERLARVESARRNSSPEENLEVMRLSLPSFLIALSCSYLKRSSKAKRRL
jgi:glutamyl/glutaminyl-tRNA synthetase